MVERSRKPKKGSIDEEDMSILLERYSVKTVLTLLQEVEKVAGEKIDWNAIVKNTTTGISSARECQMLWRHLAYGQNLTDQFDNATNPMDDDSDLEYEVEAFPAVNRETSMEAVACVKVLIASDYPIDSHPPNNLTIEAPMTINVPKLKAFTSASDNSVIARAIQGTNISIPVSVQKQPVSSGTCGEKRPPNNATSGITFPPRRRRRGWSTEDDMKLTAAVKKYGERNWANIARGDFKNDRKASELSQRWGTLRKKQSDSNVGTSSKHSESQLAAAHRAITLALNTPMGDNFHANRNMSTGGIKSQQQFQKALNPQFGVAGPPKTQVPTITKPNTIIPDSKIKAAAVAAGARIATSADASSLIEAAARSQNVVHITTGGGGTSMMKSSSTTSMLTTTSQLPSNVHFMRTAQKKAAPIPIPPHSATLPPNRRPGVEAQPPQGNSAKPAELATVVEPPSGLPNAAATPPSVEVAVVSKSVNETKEIVQKAVDLSAPLVDQSKEGVDKHQTSASGEKSADNLCTSKQANGEATTSITEAAVGDAENK
ncbi:hypothetical protein ABFS82_06G134400 [Erythranthe guttata]|uniref:uncharacterized protein LOC105953604 n=1 Tax=Erythranthe guttata TaxID=4155 RepID=UPI00064D9092|nr:PREDICTED: uncharacterized protein LOC105953604 [Erythranthe guttata]XP_012832731.1 PREDICTED: uncharacterized protein LOC105953604 [Erythranthe guttata]|eukprot:XP_012832730.1 PREDICTED: uncharacterized protein LOC105953604 [Erythranthe guttata]